MHDLKLLFLYTVSESELKSVNFTLSHTFIYICNCWRLCPTPWGTSKSINCGVDNISGGSTPPRQFSPWVSLNILRKKTSNISAFEFYDFWKHTTCVYNNCTYALGVIIWFFLVKTTLLSCATISVMKSLAILNPKKCYQNRWINNSHY